MVFVHSLPRPSLARATTLALHFVLSVCVFVAGESPDNKKKKKKIIYWEAAASHWLVMKDVSLEHGRLSTPFGGGQPYLYLEARG